MLFEGEVKKREVVRMDESLTVHVDSVHNIPNEWRERYHSFYVAVHIMHGTAVLCPGYQELPKPVINDNCFPYCHTNVWVSVVLRFSKLLV